jgi:mannose-1-phosphate guanylyltransferase/mannose-6-phosphate isomerase
MIVPVILSGGAGTRLWPLSRELHPKQLLSLIGQRTMLQETVHRLQGLDIAPPIVVCNETHRFLVAEQLRTIGCKTGAIVLEPVGRNTAPAIALAAHVAKAAGEGDASLLVLAADHVIRNVKAFHAAIATADAAAQQRSLVTFGIVPNNPETGYGYIRRGEPRGETYKIAEFVEKPDLDRANKFMASGDYYWNSGMFMLQADRYLEELEHYVPDIASRCREAFAGATRDLDFTRVDAQVFTSCRSESIDYAVMEKTSAALVVPLDAGWSDVGSWASLHAVCEQDAQKNSLIGDVMVEDTENSYIFSESRLVATVGLRDHVVIETKDAVLVAPKDRVQDVKKLVKRLKDQGRYEHALHRQVYRPWGSYDSIDEGDRFQVKRLVVRPGGVLSLQMHHHRAEHWVVVSGTARITCGEKIFLLEENQSTYIPIGARHRIENPGKIPLHIIEVQSGTYLGEDDIVRFEDQYGRQGTNT